MTESATSLHLVPAGDAPWRVVHSLPGRLRIVAPSLRGNAAGCKQVQQRLSGLPGFTSVAVAPRIGSITLRYAASLLDSREVQQLFHNELNAEGSGEPAATELETSDAHLAGLALSLVATPLLPLPLRYALTLAALSPNAVASLRKLGRGGTASRTLDSFALFLTALAGRYGVAQINNLMHTFARRLEQDAVVTTEGTIRRHALPPTGTIRLARDGEAIDCNAEGLRRGDLMDLAAGETLPLAALVLSGEAQATLGFSSEEMVVTPGSQLTAGTVVRDGTLQLVLLQDWSEGTYARLANFIEAAIRDREAHDQYAANLADRLVPYTMILSAAVYGLTHDLARATSAMQADFSASHELVTPPHVEGTIAIGASQGILFRGGKAIEQFAELDTLVFDRSGTLTRSVWELEDVAPLGDWDEQHCREHVYRLLLHCCRPAAVNAVGDSSLALLTLSHAEIHQMQEHGLHLWHGQHYLNLEEADTEDAPTADQAESGLVLHAPGLVFDLRVNGDCIARLRYGNGLAADNVGALEALRDQGLENLYLLSHERPASLHPELAALPLSGLHAGLDDPEKRRFIQQLIDEGRKVGVVSDGLLRVGKDSLVICAGTAPGNRPMEADIWLMHTGIASLAQAHRLARSATSSLKRSHRTSQVSKGAMLLATSFDLLPPALAAAIGNGVTLGVMRSSKRINNGELL